MGMDNPSRMNDPCGRQESYPRWLRNLRTGQGRSTSPADASSRPKRRSPSQIVRPLVRIDSRHRTPFPCGIGVSGQSVPKFCDSCRPLGTSEPPWAVKVPGWGWGESQTRSPPPCPRARGVWPTLRVG